MSEPITALLRRLDPRERIIATPHYVERIAAGVLEVRPGVLTAEEEAQVRAERKRIDAVRAERRRLRERRREEPMHSTAVLWRGVRVTARWSADARRLPGRRVTYTCGLCLEARGTRREAVARMLRQRVRVYGRYQLRLGLRYELRHRDDYSGPIATWPPARRPSRSAIAAAIRAHRRGTRAGRPDPHADTTLGWRAWYWDGEHLVSPHQHTAWPTPDLTAAEWSTGAAVRGEAGIHARRMPRDWLAAGWPAFGNQDGPNPRLTGGKPLVTGVVERLGRYVLGTTGWRAESVIIRELAAPSVEVMLALIERYPGVRVHLSPYAAPITIEEETCHADR